MEKGLKHNAKEKFDHKPGEASPGKHNFDIKQNPGMVQGAAPAGMSPLSLMEARKEEKGRKDQPVLNQMYPSSPSPLQKAERK